MKDNIHCNVMVCNDMICNVMGLTTENPRNNNGLTTEKLASKKITQWVLMGFSKQKKCYGQQSPKGSDFCTSLFSPRAKKM